MKGLMNNTKPFLFALEKILAKALDEQMFVCYTIIGLICSQALRRQNGRCRM